MHSLQEKSPPDTSFLPPNLAPLRYGLAERDRLTTTCGDL
jgi:hypothetical protein